MDVNGLQLFAMTSIFALLILAILIEMLVFSLISIVTMTVNVPMTTALMGYVNTAQKFVMITILALMTIVMRKMVVVKLLPLIVAIIVYVPLIIVTMVPVYMMMLIVMTLTCVLQIVVNLLLDVSTL